MNEIKFVALQHFHRYSRVGSLMQHVHSMLCRARDVSACLCRPLYDHLSRFGMPMLKGNLQGGGHLARFSGPHMVTCCCSTIAHYQGVSTC